MPHEKMISEQNPEPFDCAQGRLRVATEVQSRPKS